METGIGMSSGELVTRSTIWIAIAAYTLGCVVFATARRQSDGDRWARVAWTIGCVALVAHYLVAFNFYHAWSHASAYSETARRTAEVFRINWGGGLFINYGFACVWAADVAWWWFAGLDAYRRRPWWITLVWHGFLLFIIFNATVVFKTGLTRWIGLLVCLTLCLSWVSVSRQRRSLSTA